MAKLVITGAVPALPLVSGSSLAVEDLVALAGVPHLVVNIGNLVLINLATGNSLSIDPGQLYQVISGTLEIA